VVHYSIETAHVNGECTMANQPIPSVNQQAIIDAVRDTDLNILVEAVAGSGKSTLLEMVFCEATHTGGVSRKDAILLAFNKSVKMDLLSRNLPADTELYPHRSFFWYLA